MFTAIKYCDTHKRWQNVMNLFMFACRSSYQNLASWTGEVVSEMLMLSRWVAGNRMAGKGQRVQVEGRAWLKPKSRLTGLCWLLNGGNRGGNGAMH